MDYRLEVTRWNDPDGPSIQEVMAVHGSFEYAALTVTNDFDLDSMDRIVFKDFDDVTVYDSYKD